MITEPVDSLFTGVKDSSRGIPTTADSVFTFVSNVQTEEYPRFRGVNGPKRKL